MKIVLGVDRYDTADEALRLLSQLRFQDPEVTLVHVIEGFRTLGWEDHPRAEVDVIAKFLKMQEVESREALERASQKLAGQGIVATAKMMAGYDAARVMTQYADQQEADLMVVGCTEKGRMGGLILGSVGRKMVIGAKQSVLVAKEAWPYAPEVAVLASDHSEYATRCIPTLRRFAPKGVKKLIVMTSYPKNLVGAFKAFMSDFKLDVMPWVEEKLHESNNQVIESLTPLGWKFESRVVASTVNEAIRQTMQDSKAGLLIIGAHGHGFMERMIMGSFSLHQVVAEKHPVLVLRA